MPFGIDNRFPIGGTLFERRRRQWLRRPRRRRRLPALRRPRTAPGVPRMDTRTASQPPAEAHDGEPSANGKPAPAAAVPPARAGGRVVRILVNLAVLGALGAGAYWGYGRLNELRSARAAVAGKGFGKGAGRPIPVVTAVAVR